MPHSDATRRRCELERVFRIDTAFDRVAFDSDIALREWQLHIGCHHDLCFHNIHTRDVFRHRMLHLHTRVHLDEIKLTVFIQKLKGTRTAVTNFFTRSNTALTDFVDEFAGDAWCRRFFDHFLVTALHRTVALAQIHRVFEFVSQDLDFDVPGVLEVLLHIDRWVAKCRARFGFGHRHCVDERRF